MPDAGYRMLVDRWRQENYGETEKGKPEGDDLIDNE